MLTRTLISLERQQLRELKARAHAQGISVAALVRRLITQCLESDGRKAGAEGFDRIVGLGASGRSDVATDHDAALGDALRREHDR